MLGKMVPTEGYTRKAASFSIFSECLSIGWHGDLLHNDVLSHFLIVQSIVVDRVAAAIISPRKFKGLIAVVLQRRYVFKFFYRLVCSVEKKKMHKVEMRSPNIPAFYCSLRQTALQNWAAAPDFTLAFETQ